VLNTWSFFRRLRPFWIGGGEQRARLAQAETELSKHSLALAHAQANLAPPRDPNAEGFPLPPRPGQADRRRGASPPRLRLLPWGLAQTLGTSGSRPFHEPGQTAVFKMSNPILPRPWGVPEKLTDCRAGHTRSHEQHPVKAVIVARFLRTTNLILKSQHQGSSIGDRKWLQAPRKSHFPDIRKYL